MVASPGTMLIWEHCGRLTSSTRSRRIPWAGLVKQFSSKVSPVSSRGVRHERECRSQFSWLVRMCKANPINERKTCAVTGFAIAGLIDCLGAADTGMISYIRRRKLGNVLAWTLLKRDSRGE